MNFWMIHFERICLPKVLFLKDFSKNNSSEIIIIVFFWGYSRGVSLEILSGNTDDSALKNPWEKSGRIFEAMSEESFVVIFGEIF